MSKAKPHGRTREDVGGYFCATCGMDKMAPEAESSDCPGPPPLLDVNSLFIASQALRDLTAYNESSRNFAANNIEDYLKWPGNRLRLSGRF